MNPHRLSMENLLACHKCVRSRRAPSPATENPSAGLPASSRRRLTLLESFRGAELPSPAEPTSPVPAASSPLPRRRRLLGRCPVVRRRAERGCCHPPCSRRRWWQDTAGRSAAAITSKRQGETRTPASANGQRSATSRVDARTGGETEAGQAAVTHHRCLAHEMRSCAPRPPWASFSGARIQRTCARACT